MYLPIVVIHLDDSEYLAYTLAQAKSSNPQSDVFLNGAHSTNYYQFIEHKNISNYSYEAKEFGTIYQHFSRNSFAFEQFCFQRWLILKNFMETHNLEKCLCIDSDVMLYSNVTEELINFAKFDFTLSLGRSPHCFFLNNFNALKSFCNFIFDIYTNPSSLKIIKSTFDECIQNNIPGGASDMIAFKEFWDREYANICEISTIRGNSKYEHNINMSEGYQMCNYRKDIYFIGKKPFCNHITSNQAIKFNSLHFQGQAEKYMKHYFVGEIIIKEGMLQEVKKDEPSLQEKFSLKSSSDSSLLESRSLNKNYVILPFNLGVINLIIFPHWSAPEESLTLDLERVLRAITTHPDKSYMTLLIHIGDLSNEDVNLILSSVSLNLLMRENLDVTQGPEISLMGKLEETQWQALLPRIYARIILEKENQGAIAQAKAENIPSYKIEWLSKLTSISI